MKKKLRRAKGSKIWLIVGLISAVVAVVYEMLSHGVMAAGMILMPAWPLGRAATLFLFDKLRLYHRAGGWPRMLWQCAAATGQMGCFISGVKKIYGVRNAYGPVFFLLFAALAATAVVLWAMDSEKPVRVRV